MTEATVGGFVQSLRTCREKAGNPSLRDLVAGGMPYSRTTMSDNLRGVRLPTWDFVEAFVRACGRAAGVPEEKLDLEGWREAHRRAAAIAAAAPPTGAFAAVREAYLERLRVRYAHADLGALAPGTDPDRHRLVPLAEIFVTPAVRADPPPLELPRELVRRLVEQGEIRQGDLPPGIDEETLDQVRQAYREQPSRPVPQVVAEHPEQGLVLLGDPGAGKSTVARHLILTAAAEGEALPILVELHACTDQRRPAGTLLDLIERLGDIGGHGLRRPVLEGYLRAGGRALVIFDGLDEIFDPRQRAGIADEIAGFAARFPSARVVVTSRVIGYQRAVFDREDFRTYLLQDLDRPRIERFLTAWYRLSHPPADADRLRDRLLAATDDVPAVRELAGNPLLLTIMALLGRRRDLPRDRGDLYEHAVGVLVAQWDPSRHLHDERQTREHADLGDTDRLTLLRRIARRMQEGPAGLAGNHLLAGDLIDEVAGYLRDEHELPAGRAKAVARAIVDEFRTRNFILSHYGAGVFGFVHRAFLEHLVAAGITEQVRRRGAAATGFLSEWYAEHWPDPAYAEVLVLVAGMIDAPLTGSVVLRLLAADPLWFLSGRRDEAPRNLMLAIRCLAEVRDLGALPEPCAAVVRTAIALLEHITVQKAFAGYPLNDTVMRTTVPVLARIGHHHPALRDRYRDWYLMRGQFLRMPRELTDTIVLETPPAALTGAEFLRDDAEFSDFLTGQAVLGDQTALRLDALQALAGRRSDDPVLGALLREIAERDPDPNIRHVVVRLVALAGRPEGTALDWMRDRLTDDDRSLRDGAVQAFAQQWRGHPEALPAVCRAALSDRRPDVRDSAMSRLLHGWPGDVEAAATLRAVALADPVQSCRVRAAGLLLEGWPADPETAPLLRRIADDPDVPAHHRERLADALAHRAHTQRRPVSPAGRAEPPDPVRAVLEPIAGDAARLRETVLTSPDAAVRGAAVRALALGWPDDPGLAAWLCGLAGPAGGELREVILLAVAANWPDRPETAELLATTARRPAPAAGRRTALMLLAATRRHDPATAVLLRTLATGAGDTWIRALAAELLGAGRRGDEGTAELLRSRFGSEPDEAVRHIVLSTLVTSGMADASLLRGIAGQDSAPRLRAAATGFLARGWHGDPETLPFLRQLALSGPTGDDRCAAVRALAAGWRDDPATGELLRGIVATEETSNPEVCGCAVRALAERWPYDERIWTAAGRLAEEEAMW